SWKISFGAKDVDVTEWKGDILAVGVTEKDLARDANSKFENVILSKIDSKLGGLLAEASSEEDFSGKVGQSTVLRITGLGSKRVGLIGLGQSPSTPSPFKGLGDAVVEAAKSSQESSAAVVLASSEGLSAQSKLSTAYAIASGAVLGLFEDNRYKSEAKKSTLRSIDIIGLGMGPELEKKLKYAGDVSSGIIFGRELVNSPANVLTPGVLAEEAAKIASTYSDVFTAKILNAEQCAELKMGSYLGVAAASENPPHFIHLCYKPLSGPVNVKLALVGKGLTFDSNIVPKEHILDAPKLDEEMPKEDPLVVRLKARMQEMKEKELKYLGNGDANSHVCKCVNLVHLLVLSVQYAAQVLLIGFLLLHNRAIVLS
ncbi:Leucine aminopeptidase 1, partial [Glycine soja]